MKTILKTISAVCSLAIVMGLASCANIFDEEQLNLAPTQDLNEEKVFTDYALFRQYADHTYSFMPGHLGRLWAAMCSSMGDESRASASNSPTSTFNLGAWNGSIPSSHNAVNELNDMWKNLYTGIRKTNMMIQNIDRVENFPSEEIKNRCLGEAYFLRAFFYYELTKRWGGVPIVDKPLVMNVDNIDLPRDSYEKCIEFIVTDCDRAANGLLKPEYNDADNGRATVGAALALKSRVLLYAARARNNPTNDIEKWRRAGEAAAAVRDLNLYALESDLVNLFFKPTCNEVIMNRPRIKMNFEQGHTNGSSFLVRFIVPQGYNGWAGEAPTQNMVDRFEDANGYPIYQIDEKGNPVYEADGIMIKINPRSTYQEQDPYSNRDPRLDMFILRNDRFWYNRKTEYYKGGKDYGSNNINRYGYSIAKFWPENHQRYQGTSTYLNYIFFRYAEILLNYAEAWNEVEGPDGPHDARGAVNAVRMRVNHSLIPTDISSTKETMRSRIRNERQVELCFEEHRWYDVLSWNEGTTEFTRTISALNITKKLDGTFEYARWKVQDPIFKPHMHFYPLPDDEVYKSKVLEQNPGW